MRVNLTPLFTCIAHDKNNELNKTKHLSDWDTPLGDNICVFHTRCNQILVWIALTIRKVQGAQLSFLGVVQANGNAHLHYTHPGLFAMFFITDRKVKLR